MKIAGQDTGKTFNTGTKKFKGGSSGKYYYGGYIQVKFKKGSSYKLEFYSTGTGTATTAEYSTTRIYSYPSYTLKVNPNGGTFRNSTSTTSLSVTYKSTAYYSLGTAKRTGYTFNGFYTSKSGGTQVWNSSGIGILGNSYMNNSYQWIYTNDLTVYAQWSPITYTVQYVANGGSGNMSNSTFTYDKTGYLSSNQYTRTGYTFVGWNTKADGTGTMYQAGDSVLNWATTSTTIKLYAQWKANNYTVTIYPNGGILNGGNFGDSNGTSNKAQVTVTYGSTNYHGLGTATRTGYTFLGFYTAKTGGTQVWDANGYSTVSKYYNSSKQWIYDGNLTVYAQWYNNPPEITTGKLPSDTSNTNSGIPPYIDGDYVIIQKGDAFDIYDYFDYSDVETAKEDLKVTIKNNVPTDSNGNTTTAGTYIVTVTVTDEGGASTSAEVKVIVNDPPTLTAKDRWFYTGEVVDEAEILAKVSAVDYEDGDITSRVSKYIV